MTCDSPYLLLRPAPFSPIKQRQQALDRSSGPSGKQFIPAPQRIVTEVAEGATFQDAELKSIVSGELITAEHKHKPPFDLRPFATCWFGTNHMPQTRDFSDALFRRAMIFSFNNKFEGAACDVNLKDKLITELPGIFNLALNVIARVMESGGFRECVSLLEAKSQWRQDNDQVAQFIEERAVLNVDAI